MKYKKTLPLSVLAITLVIVTASSLRAQQVTNEWPQFRGPNGTGVAEARALPAEFNAKKNVVWKTTVPFARSSPVVTADRVFLTASEADKLLTIALDRKTGKVVWQREVVRARHMPIYKANDAASPSPVSDGKNVYAFFAELGLISYGPDGKERWRLPLGPFNSFYGMGGSPVLAGNTLVMVCDHRDASFIVAVDTRDGKVLWRKNRTNFEGYSTPAIYKPANGPVQFDDRVLGSAAAQFCATKRLFQRAELQFDAPAKSVQLGCVPLGEVRLRQYVCHEEHWRSRSLELDQAKLKRRLPALRDLAGPEIHAVPPLA